MIMTSTRTALFNLIGAIESDLRSFVKEALPDCFLKNKDAVKEEARKRYVRDKKRNPKEDLELLDFLHFGETYQILLTNKEKIREDIREEVVKHREKSELIIPIRNRVMHFRPLEEDDYYTVNEFAQNLSKDLWPECKDLYQKIQKGALEQFSDISKTEIEERIYHKLPVPDCDETGFIGRKEDVRDIKKLLYGHHPIITLYGEGGVGKTALMLKTAYDIIDDDKCPFDCVVWITCKIAELTSSGIREIKDCIKNFESMVRGIDDLLLGEPRTTQNENIEYILDWMKEFKTLLILDNLETLQSEEEMKNFLGRCSEFGKVAITSRIGLGYLDYPRKLEPMKEKEAERLLRGFAQILNVPVLYKQLCTEEIQKYVKELFLNPLAIKWFVQAVASGRDPDEAIKNKDSLREYCLSNIYDKFDGQQKAFLHAILVNAKPVSKEEIWFYTEKPNKISFENSLRILRRSSFIEIERNGENEWVYDLTDFARDYIHEEDRPSTRLYKKIRDKQDKVSGFKQSINTFSKSKYHLGYIEIRKDSEAVLAIELSEALKDSGKARKLQNDDDDNESARIIELYKEALGKVDKVKDIQPLYFEAYRISAFIHVGQGRYLAAEHEYQEALKIEPDNSRIHHFYAGFLQRCLKDMKRAKEHAERAVELDDEKSFDPRYLCARCLGFEGEYDKSIGMLKELLSRNLNRRQKLMAATQTIEFCKRKVERKRCTEKDYLKAWNIFIDGVDFFESLQEVRPDKLMKEKFVKLLDEGIQCTQDDEQRNTKSDELIARYKDLIRNFDKRGYLRNRLQVS